MLNKNLNLFKILFTFISSVGLISCSGNLSDPASLSASPLAAEIFGQWDPDTITAPGANLITFTAGDTITSFPYYSHGRTYPIKYKVNSGGLPPGVIDPGIYSVKLEYSSNNGGVWNIIPGAANIPTSVGLINSFDWAMPISFIDGSQYLLRLTATAVSGAKISTISSRNFIVTSMAPIISSFTLTLGSLGVAAATSINRSFFGFSLNATDPLAPLTSYCLKSDGSSVAPLEDNDCWVDFKKPFGTTVSEVNLPGFIGFVSGAYDLRVWVKDAANNITVMTAGTGSSGVDLLSIAYNPAAAADIKNVVISNVDSTTLIPTNAQLTFTAGQSVFLRWSASAVDLVSFPINVSYTTDEKKFVNVVSLQNVTNANQGGCTIDGNYTGCAVFPAPSSGYFRVQISAVTSTGLISKGGSVAANLGNLRLIAGNTDLGLGGSANKAVFLNKANDNSAVPSTGILLVTKRGKIFYLDAVRGVLIVDPADGAQKVFLKSAKVSIGDGGNYALAATANTFKIALDYDDRLLILEQDRVRRVEADGTINTIIGGGTLAYDNITKLPIAAGDFSFSLPSSGNSYFTSFFMFQVLPNGNIWFSLNAEGTFNNDNGNLFAIYKASESKVYFLGLKGQGAYGNPVYNLVSPNGYQLFTTPGLSFDYRTSVPSYISTYFCGHVPGGCDFASVNFNPRTGQNVGYGTHYPMLSYWGTDGRAVSRKGQLYVVSHLYPAGLFKLNYSTLNWDRILGTASYENTGSCADDVLATACDVDLADVFITENNTTYFVDRGGIVRVILPNQKIKTLFGQNLSYGNGGLPTSARLGRTHWIGPWGADNKVIVYDQTEKYVREIDQVGGKIDKLCGNGLSGAGMTTNDPFSIDLAVNRPCLGGYWGQPSSGMAVDSRSGEVYASTGMVAKLVRSGPNAGHWQNLAGGGGSKCFQNAESNNVLGNTVGSCSRTTSPGYGYPFTIFGVLNPDTLTTSAAQGAVEDTTSDAHVLISNHIWNGVKLVEPYYKTARGSDGMIRPISGLDNQDYAGGLTSTVGDNFSTTMNKPIYENYVEAVYVQNDRTVLFGHVGAQHLIRVPLTRSAADLITGGGLVQKVYGGIAVPYSSMNYRWSAVTNDISDLFLCGNDGKIYRYITATGQQIQCTFPKTSANEDMFSCYGRSLHWNSTRTKLIFPLLQNGLTAIAEFDIGSCN